MKWLFIRYVGQILLLGLLLILPIVCRIHLSLHEGVSPVFSHHRSYPHIAQKWKDEHNQSIVMEGFLEVSMENTRDSSGHAATWTIYTEDVANEANRAA